MSDKVIDRIKKLLSLSKSTNEHEAANAAAQAAELMQRHEIEMAQLEDSEQVVEDVETANLDQSGKKVSWKGSLMNGLAKSFGCEFFYARTRAGVGYTVVGQGSKVATIKYMYSYLCSEVDRLAQTRYAQEGQGSARAWKNAFRLGAANIIAQRLREQRTETQSKARLAGESQALVVVKKAEDAVQVYMAKKYPRLRSAGRATISSRGGYAAGQAAGRNVRLGGGTGRLGSGAKLLGS